MPVERDVNLDKPLTDEDIRALEEEADYLEKLAREAQDDSKKAKEFHKEEERFLNDAVKKIEELEKQAIKAEKARLKIGRSIKEVNELATHRSALSGFGGDDPFSEGEEFGMGGMIPGSGQIKKGRTGFGTGEERSPLGGLQSAREQFEQNMLEEQKKLKEEQKKAEEERKEHARQIAENKKLVMDAQKDFHEIMSATKNPLGFGIGKVKGMIGKAGIAGLIAVIVLQMGEEIFEEVKKLYGPGGPFDIRKQMLDRDREMIEMDHLLARRAGTVFFTGDVELQQGVPEYSNTERLRDRAIRYQALHLGE